MADWTRSNGLGREVEAEELLQKLMDSRDDADIMAAARELAPRPGLAPHAARLLVDLLNTGTAPRAAAAAFVLGEWGGTALGVSPALVPSLRKQTGHANVTVRHWCAAALMRLGRHAASAVPELVRCLRDDDDGVRTVAAHALGGLGRYARGAVAPLVDAVYDANADVRHAAILALGRIDLQGKESVHQIARGLESSSARARVQSAEALGALRTMAGAAAPMLMPGLHDTSALVRKAVVTALARTLPAERPLLHALGVALQDSNDEVRIEALNALAQFENSPQEAAPHLIAALRDPEPGVRFRAVDLLERFAPALGPLVPAVAVAIGNRLRDPSELVQTRAVKASGVLAQWTHTADERLVNALYDSNSQARLAATLALAHSHNDPAALDALRFRLADERADVRVAACRALLECGETADVVLPTLLMDLGDSDPAVQLDAIALLEKIGDAAASALQPLRDKAADSNADIRAAAARVVRLLERAV